MELNCTTLVDIDIDILSFFSELLFLITLQGTLWKKNFCYFLFFLITLQGTLWKRNFCYFLLSVSFFSVFFAPFLSGFYRWSPGMQTGKLPYSIASNNVHRKIAIVIDGNMHVYVQMYVLVCMCIYVCVCFMWLFNVIFNPLFVLTQKMLGLLALSCFASQVTQGTTIFQSFSDLLRQLHTLPSILLTITIYFINPSGKLKLSFDRTLKNIIILNHEPHAHTHSYTYAPFLSICIH